LGQHQVCNKRVVEQLSHKDLLGYACQLCQRPLEAYQRLV